MSKIVERTLDLLEIFGEELRPLSLSEISSLLKIPMSSCHDVVRTMQARGYLYEIAPRAGYYPTLRMCELGKEIRDNDPILMRTRPLLRSLRDTLDESVLLSKVSGMNATYLLVFEPINPLRVRVRIGDNIRSLHANSEGKALLANLDDREFGSFLASAKLAPFSKHTITSVPALRKDIELGRQRGWYLNREESQSGKVTLSASFRWNGAVYIVTVAGPTARFESKIETAAVLITDVCRRFETPSSNEVMRFQIVEK